MGATHSSTGSYLDVVAGVAGFNGKGEDNVVVDDLAERAKEFALDEFRDMIMKR